MKIVTDTHIHTVYSRCCTDPKQTVGNVAAQLAARGFKMIAVADHLWCNPEVVPLGWPAKHPLENLLPQLEEIRHGVFPLRVLASCEADMQGPGRVGMTMEAKKNFDFVSVASDHFQLKYFVDQPSEATPEKIAPLLLSFFLDAAYSGLADVLLHPLFTNGYPELFDRTVDFLSDQQFLDVLHAASERGVGLEINCGLLDSARKGQFHLDSMLRVFELAKRAGCKFTFGSDAHCTEHFQLYELAESFAGQLGLTAADLHPLIREYYKIPVAAGSHANPE